ncbi:hypothetical protein NDQ72_10950 [Halomonas sp. KG2]|uniref:hypothetical protein n=1 Tax=Halomonas sp. KG2 TaxID=2951138 RepID=UPI002647DA65|nr:hypothetical protein [Halomonas sp. KG2]WKD26592.1 hypothetical protein NDQ72_10950 [Halomonas sp. KG2]
MAAKQYVVVRGQIEKGKEVLAKQGEPYKPQNAAEEKRLLDAGVIAELGAPAKGKGKGTSKAKRSSTPPENPTGGTGDDENSKGEGTGTGEGSGGGSGDE